MPDRRVSSTVDRLQGLLVGTAVGDALGLPMEGLSPRRARRIFGPVERYRFLPDKGMVSDDTEHSIFVAQCVSFTKEDGRPIRLFWPGIIPRNVLFLAVVLMHGFRRMFPRY